LRKYAEMVGVSIEDVMTDYYKMTRATSMPPVIGPTRKLPREINAGPWIAGIVIVLVLGGVAAAAFWWFAGRETAPDRQPLTTSPAIIETVPALPDETESDASGEASDEQMQPEAAAAPSDEPDAAAIDTDDALANAVPQSTASTVPQVTIRLSFSADCWTEISDASGNRLFYDLATAGRVVNLSGEPPVRIVFGDADNVSMTVDGQAYEIPQSARRGRLARLTINSQ
jgi:cytoskeleton protein RodZ